MSGPAVTFRKTGRRELYDGSAGADLAQRHSRTAAR